MWNNHEKEGTMSIVVDEKYYEKLVFNKLNTEMISGRGYQISDKSLVANLSYFSGLISILEICLYIESQQALTLYNQ